MDGMILIDKPQSFTSFDVVAVMRGLCRQKKVGHTGTLDPMATGVLPILLGKATRCAPFLEDTNKEYQAEFQLGTATDTQDNTGKVLSQSDKKVTAADVEQVLTQFRGDIMQLPPMYSAGQKDGQRLYVLARQGIEVEREKRPVTIYKCELLTFDEATQTGTLCVACSKGTYIRTLCHDIGETLGTYGMMTALRRTIACGFVLSDTIPLLDAKELVAQGGSLEDRVIPIDTIFKEKPDLQVSQAQTVRFRNGGGLGLERLRFSAAQQQEDGNVYRVYGYDKSFLGLGIVSVEKGELRILRLFCGDDKS